MFELPLDDGRLILPGAPDVRDERVITVFRRQRERRLLAVLEAERGRVGMLQQFDDNQGHNHAKEDEDPDQCTGFKADGLRCKAKVELK